MSHIPISPAIYYWGTPVVIISSLNPDNTTNLAPMSSAFWLGNRCILGLASYSQTTQNMVRTKQCVLNLPTSSMGDCINVLAKTTGTANVPEGKMTKGYRYESDKWTISGLSPEDSQEVKPRRVRECPVQMECEVVAVHDCFSDLAPSPIAGAIVTVEVKVLRTYVEPELRLEGHKNRIDTEKWRPMIMMFQELYGLEGKKRVESRLAEIEEEKYRIA